jgi:hypothetical protein
MAIQINGTSGISGVDGSAATPALQGSDSNTGISFGTDEVNINTDGTTRATVDSSGRVLAGTSSTSENCRLVVSGRSASGTDQGVVFIQRGSSGPGVVANGSGIGEIIFSDSDGNQAARIDCLADATWGAGGNDYPGRLTFSTTADGASSPTERMRIRNNGRMLFGQQVFDNGLLNVGNYTNGDKYGIEMRPSADNATPFAFDNAAGTLVGSISTTSSATSYNTSSDYRLKENIVPLTGAADRLNQLQVHRFNFIADPDTTVDGFIAHEAQAIVPECVTGEKDAVDDEGNPVYQGIDQSKLVPLLTAALQEALAKIETLETKVAALEGGAN